MVFTLKIFQNGNVIKKVHTHKIRRFLKILRTIKWQNSTFTVYVKVRYGKFMDNFGKHTEFYNDGDYDNTADFWQAVEAFMED